jgi:hypothetical protein
VTSTGSDSTAGSIKRSTWFRFGLGGSSWVFLGWNVSSCVWKTKGVTYDVFVYSVGMHTTDEYDY